MQDLIKVIDADLRLVHGAMETIKVWHESFGNPISLDTICGHDFFLRWMPSFIRHRYKTLSEYWDTTHPHRRDEHIAEYLLDRSNLTYIITGERSYERCSTYR